MGWAARTALWASTLDPMVLYSSTRDQLHRLCITTAGYRFELMSETRASGFEGQGFRATGKVHMQTYLEELLGQSLDAKNT